MSTPVNRIEKLLEEAQNIAREELQLNNIFYNERYVEMMMADILGQKYGNNTQGGDAVDEYGDPVEYIAINLTNLRGKGSFQFHWLSENKIKKYGRTRNMYFAIRNGVIIEKIYELNTDVLMPFLLEKSTGGKSINGHFGFKEERLVNEFKAKLVYQK